MQITIPDETVKRAAERAAHIGYKDVEQYIVELIHSDETSMDAELLESLALIERSMADVAAGRTLSPAEALRQTQQELGFTGE